MNNYQRHITYLYKRGESQSEKSIGFAKIERHMDRMRIQIQVRGCQDMEGRWPIYLCGKDGTRNQIDCLQIRKGAGAKTILLQTQDEGAKEVEIGEGEFLIAGLQKKRNTEHGIAQTLLATEVEEKNMEEPATWQDSPTQENTEIQEQTGAQEYTEAQKQTGTQEYTEAQGQTEAQEQIGTQGYTETQDWIEMREQTGEQNYDMETPAHKESQEEIQATQAHVMQDIFANCACRKIQIWGDVYLVRKMKLTEFPKELQYYTKDSFLLHAYFQNGYLLLGKCFETNRWLIGIPGRSDCTSELAAKTHGFKDFYPRKTRSPFPTSGFWFRIQE